MQRVLFTKLGRTARQICAFKTRLCSPRRDGLILPKDDPFWNSHFPPKEFRCKCYTRAVSEPRKRQYERDGIRVPPKADGSGAGVIKVKTKAPAEEYTTYFNERKGLIERLPKGVAPGFNWHQGKMSRSVPATFACLKKAQDKLPEAVDAVIKTLQTSQIYQPKFRLIFE